MAEKDQRDAREADVARRDRRRAEPEEGSNNSRHEQMDSCIGTEGIRFLEAPWSATPRQKFGYRPCHMPSPGRAPERPGPHRALRLMVKHRLRLLKCERAVVVYDHQERGEAVREDASNERDHLES